MDYYPKKNGILVLLLFIAFLIGCLGPINKYSKKIDSALIEIKIIDAIITKEETKLCKSFNFSKGEITEWIKNNMVPKNGYYFGIIEYSLKNNSEDNYEINSGNMQVIVDGRREFKYHQRVLDNELTWTAVVISPFTVDKGKTKSEKLLFTISEQNISDATFQFLNLSPIKIEFKNKDIVKNSSFTDKEEGEKPSSIEKFEKSDLLYAVMAGDIEKVKKIIASGIDINCKDTSGNTPLILAASYGHDKILELLIAKGTDLYMKNNSSTNALGFATYKGNTNIVKLLLASGVPPNLRINDQYGTALMLAVIHGHKDLASLLLEKGAEVSAKNQDGTTPLIFAAINGHIKIMQLLFKNGASANCHDIYGATPLMFAAIKGHSNVADFLITKGADINATLNTGDTAIMMAAKNGHHAVVKVLLENGADINLRNKKGQCALDLAEKKGNFSIIKLLQQK